MKHGVSAIAFVLSLLLAHGSKAEAKPARLDLDGLSFVSFDGRETYQIPTGAHLTLRFEASKGSSVAFTIRPEDVVIPPISMGGDSTTLTYALAGPAQGTLRRVGDEAAMDFSATVRATLRDAEGAPIGDALSYSLRFTTERAVASDVNGERTVEVEGAPVVEGPNYVQLVGAATNKPDAFPEPGVAVYAVLSGRFDWLPELPQE